MLVSASAPNRCSQVTKLTGGGLFANAGAANDVTAASGIAHATSLRTSFNAPHLRQPPQADPEPPPILAVPLRLSRAGPLNLAFKARLPARVQARERPATTGGPIVKAATLPLASWRSDLAGGSRPEGRVAGEKGARFQASWAVTMERVPMGSAVGSTC
jgi:hypothetical protein